MALVSLALLLIGVFYLAVQCQHIPAPLPGREAGSTKHRIGFAAVALLAAAVAAGGAFYAGRARPDSS